VHCPRETMDRLTQRCKAVMTIRRVLVMSGIWVLAGHATAAPPLPAEDFVLGRAAIAEAVSAGAVEHAPAILGRAEDELRMANAAMASGRIQDARRFAQDAEVDAQLAAAVARARRAEQALANVEAEVRALREQASLAP